VANIVGWLIALGVSPRDSFCFIVLPRGVCNMGIRSASSWAALRGQRWLAVILAIAGVFGFVSTSRAVAIIGNFETGALDAWGTDGGPGSPTLSQSTTLGVTLGSGALRSSNAQGGFWGPATGNLITQGYLADLQTATQLALDMTLISSEINGGSGNFAGFAQSNELAFILFSNASGTLPGGVNAFIQRNYGTGSATDSSGQNGTWSGVDGTRAVTWDLTKFTLTDPTDSVVKTVAQFLTAHPDTQSVKFAFTQQTGGGSPVGPSNFYFDNVRLVPEPGSIALIAFIVPALAYAAARIRKQRSRGEL
jgi:hypothetical protein